MPSKQRSLIALIYSLGVLVSMSFGMMGPLASDLLSAVHGSMQDIGNAYGIRFIPFVLAGVVIGWVTDRIGIRNVLLFGALLLLAADISDYYVGSLAWFMVDNFVLGIGIITVLVAGQTALAKETSGKTQASVLALFGTATPVGTTLGFWLAGSLADTAMWRMTFALQGLLTVAIAVLAILFMQRRSDAATANAHAGHLRGLIREYKIIRLSVSWMCIALISVGPITVWPVYLSKLHDVPIGTISKMAGLAAPAGILGGVAISYLLALSVSWRKIVLIYVALSILTVPVLYSSATDLRLVVVAMALAGIGVQAAQAFCYALLPRLMGDKQNIGAATGLFHQMGSVCSVCSPPLFFAISTLHQASAVYIFGIILFWLLAALAMPVWGLPESIQPEPIQEHA